MRTRYSPTPVFLAIAALLLAALLAACSPAATAEQAPIAYAPKSGPIAQYPPAYTLVYHAYLEMKVSNLDRAIEKATQLAYNYGGYLSGSQTWYVDGRKVASLELAVPNANFDPLRKALYGLGSLVSENTSSQLVDTYPGDKRTLFSTITVQLRTGAASAPPIQIGGWNPGRTLQNAFSVFVSIFGFLADIFIWLVVVVGPFLLAAIIARVLIRRFRRSA
ncbi:MAG: DUF4349 domain-containing protein [Chloroflexota bacterium]